MLVDEKGKNIKVVEIAPPSVTTDLHRERSDPSDNTKEKSKNALSPEEYMEDVARGWEGNLDIIAPGPAGKAVDKWYGAFGEMYEEVEKPALENAKKGKGLTF